MLSLPRIAAARIIVPLVALLCLLPFINAGMALVLGISVSLLLGNPYATITGKITRKLLPISVIGLGAGMNLVTVAETGMRGIGYTALSIIIVVAAGLALGKWLRCERDSSVLVTIGTAICGGSAIAAVAPVLNAKPHSITVAMAVVFILNAVALFLFPWVGHLFELSQTQFGLWAALAIHDTSSVVGAGMHYGEEALEVGTTVKLARALWIVPLVFAAQAMIRHQSKTDAPENQAKPSYPWFILGFLFMAALMTFVPALQPAGDVIESCARRLLVLTLFLIGVGITRETIKAVGLKPLLQGAILWMFVTVVSLSAILGGLIG